VVAAQLDRRASGPTVARIRQGAHDYDVALHFEADAAVLALCVSAAKNPPVSTSSTNLKTT